MDYSSFRRSQNIEQASPYTDPFFALLLNPMRSQWIDPNGLNQNYNGLGRAQIAADFPNHIGPDMQPYSPLAMQLGAGDLSALMQLFKGSQLPIPQPQAPIFPNR